MDGRLPLVLRLARRLDPELAHAIALRGVRLWPAIALEPSPRLRTRLASLELPHPVGLAAGFDKNAVAVDALFRLGFAFVEVGTVTPRPQPGHPRPRLFRLVADRAIVNRMGFNNDGMERVAARLERRRGRPGVVGVNVGINRDSEDPRADFRRIYERLAPLADYVTINVSSPNTPGLRELQAAARLRPILADLGDARARLGCRGPIFLKIAPDLEEEEIAAIVETALSCGIEGIVATNTTIKRPAGLRSLEATEPGGLSGAPLFGPSTAVLARVARLAAGRLALVGCGGIFGPEDAFSKIRAGARAVQLYTALVFEGPGVVRRIVHGLDAILEREGWPDLLSAVAADLGSAADGA
ncbi:Dihydroorotate dehydrogenase (quinone) [bacterium HR40]|nr:Dihydroorotate dehydrogenase (quinone) [bacterium HR40]